MVMASLTVREETLRRMLRTSSADMAALEHIASQAGHASGMQSVAFTPASAVAALFATTGQDLGMVGTSSMAHDVLDRTADGIHVAMRFPGLEVGTVGGGTGMNGEVRTLALQANNGTLTADDRGTIADQIERVRSRLLSLANTQSGGRYLFGGTKTDAPPFAAGPPVSAARQRIANRFHY